MWRANVQTAATVAVAQRRGVRSVNQTPLSRTVYTRAETTDILIIGTGAGSLTAALLARSKHHQVVMAEKQATVGGSSVISGGGLWIPSNPISIANGVADSKTAALQYFEQAVGDVGPASSLARRIAFLDNGPKMVSFLQDQGFKFHASEGYPDYYPKMQGAMGKGGGRSIETEVFDSAQLGDWQDFLPPAGTIPAIYTYDAPIITRMFSSAEAFSYAMRRLTPLTLKILAGQKPTSMGRGLVAQLLYLNKKYKTDIRTKCKLTNLTVGPDNKVKGATFDTSGGILSISAARGVLLATGGFAHNQGMRDRYMPLPESTSWTSTPAGDIGEGIKIGIGVGAATGLMDDAWWGPSIIDPVTGKPSFALLERARPYCLIVDWDGQRIFNEAESYVDACHAQYRRNQTVQAIPAWMILDANHRNRYFLGSQLMPGVEPTKAIEEGRMFKAWELKDLAQKIGISSAGLEGTVGRYNLMCKTGVDEDFGKGENAYDAFFGDPDVRPNPNMGPVRKAPFYAIAIWPGDLGTKGGLLTDEFQRVLRDDGTVIEGLYGCGNTTASIMGHTYLGSGSTLGPALTHGFVAVKHMLKPSGV